jgi:hypothetical protein
MRSNHVLRIAPAAKDLTNRNLCKRRTNRRTNHRFSSRMGCQFLCPALSARQRRQSRGCRVARNASRMGLQHMVRDPSRIFETEVSASRAEQNLPILGTRNVRSATSSSPRPSRRKKLPKIFHGHLAASEVAVGQTTLRREKRCSW